MPAVFQASASFALPPRRWFVVCGDIVSGVIKKDMVMRLRGGSPATPLLTIAAVEIVTKEKGGSQVGICVPYGSVDELSRLQSLNVDGKIIDISEPESDENQG